jgi:hypothetical protein
MTKRVFLQAALPCFLTWAAFASPVMSETVAAETAAHLLAKSYAVDSKCRYLNGAGHEELAALVARAEVALASQTDVATTKSTMAAGRNAGQAAICSADREAEVNDVLSAARAASQMADTSPPAAATPDAKPAVQASPKVRPGGNLQSYAAMTERYYRARRCFSMPLRQMQSFYQDVVATHRVMVKTYGVSAVAAVMHQSESRADQQGCS